jgi:PTS system nitrogen regulatory IIA component
MPPGDRRLRPRLSGGNVVPIPIATLLKPGDVIATLRATTKPEVLRDLAEHAGTALGAETDTILNLLNAREQLGSTGIGNGVALPHAYMPGLDAFFGLVARLRKGIDFAAIDALPVDLVFLLLTPQGTPSKDHLAGLASITRRLRDRDTADKLRRAKDEAAIYAILTDTPQPAAR